MSTAEEIRARSDASGGNAVAVHQYTHDWREVNRG